MSVFRCMSMCKFSQIHFTSSLCGKESFIGQRLWIQCIQRNPVWFYRNSLPRQSLTVHPCPGSSAAHWTWDSLLDQRSLGLHLKSTDKTCFISRSQAVLGSTARNVGITDKFHIVRLFYEQEQDSVQHCINVQWWGGGWCCGDTELLIIV